MVRITDHLDITASVKQFTADMKQQIKKTKLILMLWFNQMLYSSVKSHFNFIQYQLGLSTGWHFDITPMKFNWFKEMELYKRNL